MRDMKTFVKLFDLNVPEFEHFDYYILQYSKMNKWKNIYEMIKLYEDFEESCIDTYAYKVDKSNQLIEFIKNTRSYNELNDDNLIPDLPMTKNFEYSEDKKYLSIDINKANWFVFKKYDPDFINELGDSYEELLEKFDIHPVFNHSKQFRQYIFGNLNPKRQIKAQRVIVEGLINKIKSISDLEIVCIKNDEVIFSFNEYFEVEEIVSSLDLTDIKYKIFKVQRCEEFRVNHFFNINGEFIHKELSGCNGSKYFMFLKKYILNEAYDVRDLYFRMDGDLAIWNIDGLKVDIK